MAQQVVIAGTMFNDVPAVSVPDSNNVYHSFTDVSDTTAVASDVASGKYFYTAGGVKTAGTGSGGGASLGTKTITANGTYDAEDDGYDGYSSVDVNVSGGGGSGLEYETGTWTPTSDITQGMINFSNSHTEAPAIIVLADVTGTTHSTTNSNYAFVFFDYYKLWGNGIPYAADGFRYASVFYDYRASNTSTVTVNGMICTYNSDNPSDASTAYPRYWATESRFRPYTNSSSRYWRRNRTYKWIAIWA